MTSYLYYLPLVHYNNDAQAYKLAPLKDSNIKELIVFCGKDRLFESIPKESRPEQNGVVYFFLKSDEPIENKNYYTNVLRLSHLSSLFNIFYCDIQQIEIPTDSKAEEIFNQYKSEIYSNKKVRYGGLSTGYNDIKRMGASFQLINNLSEKDYLKFFNALYTYNLAKEIFSMKNVQLKYTLFMTLIVSVLNQLANDVQSHCGGSLKCTKCNQVTNLHHKDSSERKEIINLIEELFDSVATKNDYKKLVLKVYDEYRSGFLHSGTLKGKEMEGGFLSLSIEDSDSKEIMENMVNLDRFSAFTLEEFLNKRGSAGS